MSDSVPISSDPAMDQPLDAPVPSAAEASEAQKSAQHAPAVDIKSLTDRALHFLATATNETLVACFVGLGAGTYLFLGRVGLVLIGVAGGVVLHATWEGQSQSGDSDALQGTKTDARRRELGVHVAARILDWRDSRAKDKAQPDVDNGMSDMSLKLYSGKTLDYSEFKPETAAALTELTDAVIRDYVKYVFGPPCR